MRAAPSRHSPNCENQQRRSGLPVFPHETEERITRSWSNEPARDFPYKFTCLPLPRYYQSKNFNQTKKFINFPRCSLFFLYLHDCSLNYLIRWNLSIFQNARDDTETNTIAIVYKIFPRLRVIFEIGIFKNPRNIGRFKKKKKLKRRSYRVTISVF